MKKKNNGSAGKLVRATPPPPSPGSNTSKNVFNQPSSSNLNTSVTQSTNIPVGATHSPGQHSVPIGIGIQSSGVVVIGNPFPIVQPSTTQTPPPGEPFIMFNI